MLDEHTLFIDNSETPHVRSWHYTIRHFPTSLSRTSPLPEFYLLKSGSTIHQVVSSSNVHDVPIEGPIIPHLSRTSRPYIVQGSTPRPTPNQPSPLTSSSPNCFPEQVDRLHFGYGMVRHLPVITNDWLTDLHMSNVSQLINFRYGFYKDSRKTSVLGSSRL